MNTSANSFMPNFDHDLSQGQTSTPSVSKKKNRSLASLIHNPRHFLAVVMGVALVSVFGIGLVAVMQSMNRSTDDRSQAYVPSSPHSMDIYFDPDRVTLPAGAATPSATVPVKLVAGHTVGAVTFGLSFSTTLFDGNHGFEFIPNSQYQAIIDTSPNDLDNNATTKEVLVMVSAKDASSVGVLGGQLGSLKITPKSGLNQVETVKFLVPNELAASNTVGVRYAASRAPGLSEVIIFDAAAGSSGQYKGMVFNVNPRNQFKISPAAVAPTATPTPGGPTPVPPMFSGVSAPGMLEYCMTNTNNCVDSQWEIADVTNGVATVPAGTQQFRYGVNNLPNPAGWSTNMRVEIPARNLIVQPGTQVTVSELLSSNWPLVVGTVYYQNIDGNAFICTTRPVPGNPDYRYKQYVRRPVGSSIEGYPASDDGKCVNNTRIEVRMAGQANHTPTPTPTPTATPTPTPTPGSQPAPLSCRSTAPKLDSPIAISPSVVAVDNGSRFVLKWKNVLKTAAPQGGSYGVYLINDGSATPYYLFDVIDNNIAFSTTSSGALSDPTLNLAPGSGDNMTYTWTVPTSTTVVDKLGTPVKDRSFYRFMVYARLSDGTNSCSSQATIGRWAR